MRLFISYAHVDKPQVNDLVEILREAGYDPWFDHKLMPGQDWKAELQKAIHTCDAFLYALTPESVASEWCQWEFSEAVRIGKPFIPVLLQAKTKLPDTISRFQYADFTEGATTKAAARLLGGLRSVMVVVTPAILPPAPVQPTGVPAQAATPTPHPPPPSPMQAERGGEISVSSLSVVSPAETASSTADIMTALQEADAAHEAGDFKRAVGVLSKVKTDGLPRSLERAVTASRQKAEDALQAHETQRAAQRQAEEEYALIASLVKGRLTRETGCEDFQEFRQRYPHFEDSAKLADLCVPPAPDLSQILPAPFDWCYVPAGSVTIEYGEWKNSKYIVQRKQAFPVAAFHIAKYPVTNAQFALFVKEGYGDARWWDFSDEAKAWRQQNSKPQAAAFGGVADHPRVNVTWYEAVAFCRWLNAKIPLTPDPSSSQIPTPNPSPSQWGGAKGRGLITLPTEQQWQRAAQGDDGREYPWVGGFDKAKCNTSESGIRQTTPVTKYPQGASPYGVFDLAGNVWEWNLTTREGNSMDITGNNPRVVRGGSWSDLQDGARVAYRAWGNPLNFDDLDGCRVVFAAPII